MAELTKSQQWFKDHVVENEKELIEIGEIANRMLHDKLSLGINDPLTTIAIYSKIFESLCDVVAEKENEWSDFTLNVANRLALGYTTTSNEDDEKVGNFMVFIQHIESNTSDSSLDEDEDDTIELCTQWNAANIKVQADVIKEVASRAKKDLGDIINIKFESHEFIIPMFCIIHSQILKYIKLKRVEENKVDYEINVAGLFDVGVQQTEDAEEEIYYVPSIALKLRFKNDAAASGSQDSE